MTKLVGFGLLTSAFAPMVALLAVLRFAELGWAAGVLLAACALSLALLGLVLHQVQDIQNRVIESKTVRRADERVLGFTASFIVPVVVAVFGQSSATTLIATVGLVLFLALIYVRGGMFHLNPTLAILGYRLYEVTAQNDTVTMLLTRATHLPQSGDIEGRYLGDDVAIQIGELT